MKNNEINQLDHLTTNVVQNTKKNTLCMYSLALEGWRRGLTLRFFGNKNIRFSLSSNQRTHKFNRSRGDKVPIDAVKTCIDKNKTKQVLSNKGVPVPEGTRFFINETSDDEIVSYANSIGFPVVVKPTSGSLGNGVMANLENEKDLKEALHYVTRVLNYNDIIIEKQIPGGDFRLYVVGDKVAGAINRIPANIIGDGENSIEQLIEMKNKLREKNPFLSHGLIKVDNEVRNYINKAGYTLKSVPKNEEQIFLRSKSNAAAGGDTIDVTHNLSSKIKRDAVEAAKAIPGLVQCGVDMIIDNIDSVEHSKDVVIEINSRAELGIHLYPLEGEARDIPAEIIDFYFPETVNLENENRKSNFYFNFEEILTSLDSNSIKEVEISPVPHNIVKKRWVITGKVQGVWFRKWIQNKAKELNLHGHARNLKSGNVVVIVAGKKESVEELKKLCYVGPKNAEVDEIKVTTWQKPVMFGFRTL